MESLGDGIDFGAAAVVGFSLLPPDLIAVRILSHCVLDLRFPNDEDVGNRDLRYDLCAYMFEEGNGQIGFPYIVIVPPAKDSFVCFGYFTNDPMRECWLLFRSVKIDIGKRSSFVLDGSKKFLFVDAGLSPRREFLLNMEDWKGEVVLNLPVLPLLESLRATCKIPTALGLESSFPSLRSLSLLQMTSSDVVVHPSNLKHVRSLQLPQTIDAGPNSFAERVLRGISRPDLLQHLAFGGPHPLLSTFSGLCSLDFQIPAEDFSLFKLLSFPRLRTLRISAGGMGYGSILGSWNLPRLARLSLSLFAEFQDFVSVSSFVEVLEELYFGSGSRVLWSNSVPISWTLLKNLQFSCYEVEGAFFASNSFPSVQKLVFHVNTFVSQKPFASVVFPCLRALNVRVYSDLQDRTLTDFFGPSLPQMQNLVSLKLDGAIGGSAKILFSSPSIRSLCESSLETLRLESVSVEGQSFAEEFSSLKKLTMIRSNCFRARFLSLESLRLEDCSIANTLFCEEGLFPLLRTLILRELPSIDDANWIPFPFLECLEIVSCPNLTDRLLQQPVFPKLRKLTLRSSSEGSHPMTGNSWCYEFMSCLKMVVVDSSILAGVVRDHCASCQVEYRASRPDLSEEPWVQDLLAVL